MTNVYVDSGSVRFVQSISAGPHTFLADEPKENGGNDVGPDPFDLLLAALGSCASTTVQMYAQRKQWPLGAVHVELSYVREPVGDGVGAEKTPAAGIEIGLSFSGDLSGDQVRRLLEIAGRCPVHRLLTSQVQIHTTLLGPSSPS